MAIKSVIGIQFLAASTFLPLSKRAAIGCVSVLLICALDLNESFTGAR